ncbi:MAG: hypothetical protein GPJ54_08575 [Candidatus Heimdallarchaeota archaeon]|nr:hypothetical protein [Candidatus Heimdallarchaeota archaeon]
MTDESNLLKENCDHGNLIVYNYATIAIEMRKDSGKLVEYEKISEEIIEGDTDNVEIICILCNLKIKNKDIETQLSYY